MSDELVYRQRALEHRAQDPGAVQEPLELPEGWSRWTWPVMLLIVVLASALGVAFFEGG